MILGCVHTVVLLYDVVLVQKYVYDLLLHRTRTFCTMLKFFCPNGRTQHIISVVYEIQCASDLFNERMNPAIAPAFAMLMAAAVKKDEEEKEKKRKSKWMKDWLEKKERGSYCQIFRELGVESRKDFANYCRLPPEIFFMLLNKVII